MDDLMKDMIYKIKVNADPLPVDIHIQPIFDLSSFQVLGGEILARGYIHGTVIPFAKFIDELNHPEAISNLGRYVIKKTCSFIQKEKLKNLFFSINVSYKQIQQRDFFSFLEKTMEHYSVSPKSLMLEITCDTHKLDAIAMENLNNLNEKGIGIAWDNISTLSQLRILYEMFPVRIIKLKPGKITDEKIEEIKSIMDFAKVKEIEIIAERLETMKQTSIFLRNNVTKGQGYIYSRAVNTLEFKKKFLQPDT